MRPYWCTGGVLDCVVGTGLTPAPAGVKKNLYSRGRLSVRPSRARTGPGFRSRQGWWVNSLIRIRRTATSDARRLPIPNSQFPRSVLSRRRISWELGVGSWSWRLIHSSGSTFAIEAPRLLPIQNTGAFAELSTFTLRMFVNLGRRYSTISPVLVSTRTT